MAEALPLLAWARDRGRDLEWEVLDLGAERFLRTGDILPEADFLEIRDGADAVLLGAVGDPRIPDGRHAEGILLRLRRELRLGVNWRPCRPLGDGLVPLKGVSAGDLDLEVFRENTEGAYCLEGESAPDRRVDRAVHTRPAVSALLREAFQRARSTGKPLALAHKANVLKHGHGLWLEVFQDARREYPEVRAEALHADALLFALVRQPQRFGVIAAENFIGDLLSDLLAAYLGGLGMAPSLSYAPGSPYRCTALAEPVHGSAPDIAGTGRANPFGMLLSLGLLFGRWGWTAEAEAIQAAVARCVESGPRPLELGGTARTSEAGAAVRALL